MVAFEKDGEKITASPKIVIDWGEWEFEIIDAIPWTEIVSNEIVALQAAIDVRKHDRRTFNEAFTNIDYDILEGEEN